MLLFREVGEYDGTYDYYDEAVIAIYQNDTFLGQKSIGRSDRIKIGKIEITLKDIDIGANSRKVSYASVNIVVQ